MRVISAYRTGKVSPTYGATIVIEESGNNLESRVKKTLVAPTTALAIGGQLQCEHQSCSCNMKEEEEEEILFAIEN